LLLWYVLCSGQRTDNDSLVTTVKKGVVVEKKIRLVDRVASLMVGFAFLVIALLLLLLGLTFLPVIGVTLAIPILRLSLTFLWPEEPLSKADEQVYPLPCMAKAA
jgi:hypothetical protein